MSNCKFHTNQFHGECCVCGASVSDIISTLQVRNETLEKAASALHNRIVDLGREYDVDDCHIINEAIAIDIMLLGGEESDLAALLQETDMSDAIGLELERRGMSKYTEAGLIADLNKKIATQQARIEALEDALHAILGEEVGFDETESLAKIFILARQALEGKR